MVATEEILDDCVEKIDRNSETTTSKENVNSTNEVEPQRPRRRSSGMYKAPPKAALSSILAKHQGDASLEKYKRDLLGDAAVGGYLAADAELPRVVIEEFRIIFEGRPDKDVVYKLSTPEGLHELKTKAFDIKQGSLYKFRISFTVNREIVVGLQFKNTVRSKVKNEVESCMLGCYGPSSEPHVFEYPRCDWAQAPKGLMFRGKWKAVMEFFCQDHVRLHHKYFT